MHVPSTRNNISESDRAFTLVELMVVVAIMGVLLLGAYGLFNKSIQNENLRQCQANVDIINQAIMRAVAIDGRSLAFVGDAEVSPYITGGIGSLKCQVRKNPQTTYKVDKGVISPAHSH